VIFITQNSNKLLKNQVNLDGNFIFKKSNKFCKKPKQNMSFLPLCDLSKLKFSTLFEKDIK